MSTKWLDTLETPGQRLDEMERRIEGHKPRDVNSGLVAHAKAVTSQTPSPHSKTSRRWVRLLPWFAALVGLFVASVVASAAVFEPPIVLEAPEPVSEGWFGTPSSVPDVTGDGHPDILISSGGADGLAYLYDGISRQLFREFFGLGGFGNVVQQFGFGIDDLNGDGRGDVVVGASAYSVEVLDGTTGDVLHFLEAGKRGTEVFDFSAVPDVNWDGRPDIAIGVLIFDSNPASGAVKIYDGASGAELRTFSGTGSFGWSVSGIPDVNGDDRGDVIVGAPGANRAYIHDGATGARLHMLSGSGEFGRSVSGLGDVNGDGRGDVAVSANGARRAYIYDGATGTRLHTLSAPGNPAHLGWFLDRLPDVNGDGRDDVAVAGPPMLGPIVNTGSAYVFSGVTGELLATLPRTTRVAGLPDVNGDGLAEVLAGNPRADSTGGVDQAGQVLLYLSKPTPKQHRIAPLGWIAEGFNLQLRGEVGLKFELQRSEDLINWSPIAIQTHTRAVAEFLDPDARNSNRRFYRTRTVP